MVHVVMASLQEQEGDLEAQIETYRSQVRNKDPIRVVMIGVWCTAGTGEGI